MNPLQLRELVVRPSLKLINLWSKEAEALVMGTAATESRFEYIEQIGGPALGLWQMEPATHDDIWLNYLDFRPNLADSIMEALNAEERPLAERLAWDLRYGAIMCRVHYRRSPKPLPDAQDIWSQGRMWKSVYNTKHGKGEVEDYVFKNKLIGGTG